MKICASTSQFNLSSLTNVPNSFNSQFVIPIKTTSPLRLLSKPPRPTSFRQIVNHSTRINHHVDNKPLTSGDSKAFELEISQASPDRSGTSRFLMVGAVSVGVVLLLMGMDGEKALALGPEGPLMEEFWENVRRYGLYALTVSTGAIYTILQPIFELLKNPISAILILVILGGGIFIVSQVVSAMVGISDFSYEYQY